MLIVEDELFIRLAATELIAQLGLTVCAAFNADDAISILEAHSEITVVFTDIQMAGSMDGLALCIWAVERWPQLRFIVASGGVSPLITDMPAGAVFISEPYTVADISMAIASFR
ncbi:response regulator [Sphingomonas sp. BIUV-7]|uniref:Response regulator n=1 Tax=Sphingomonas natans TaxID=3063330 RepID=A0ABT8Y8E9_9SPHN|nr:response regulator [Sphingomonas sp. BIUV-7]MDO6414607.1 response regulator [Sphingomonas sp. BIUV-7]